MTRLAMTKNTEAKTVACIWNMGRESLDPKNYGKLENALKQLCETRRIDNEVVALEQKVLSGKKLHFSDCETSGSPAMLPGPCNCDA